MRVLFLDTETTGLDVARHEVWEFAAIEFDVDKLERGEIVATHHLVWEPTYLENAEPGALQTNHYYDRMAEMKPLIATWGGQLGERRPLHIDPTGERLSVPHDAAEYIARLCSGALLVASNPGFDNEFLSAFCRSQSHVFAPFHRKINVVDLALQRCRDIANNHVDPELAAAAEKATQLPHSSSKVLDAAGCPKNKNAHTAVGDAWHVHDAFFHLWSGELP